jgi:hypothetical protein
MTQAGFGLALLVVVALISWRERRVIYPLCAIALGVIIGDSAGILGDAGNGIDDIRRGFNSLSTSIFR